MKKHEKSQIEKIIHKIKKEHNYLHLHFSCTSWKSPSITQRPKQHILLCIFILNKIMQIKSTKKKIRWNELKEMLLACFSLTPIRPFSRASSSLIRSGYCKEVISSPFKCLSIQQHAILILFYTTILLYLLIENELALSSFGWHLVLILSSHTHYYLSLYILPWARKRVILSFSIT